jgi:intracellular multiplication protein IcmG
MMVDEKDEHYEDEEEEYHFSDEQLNFDVEPETSKEEAAPPPPRKESLLSKLKSLTPRRRAMIAGVIFIILMGVVYQMLKPAKNPTPLNMANELKPVNVPPVTKPTAPPPEQVVVQPPMGTVTVTPPPQVVVAPPPVVQPSPPAASPEGAALNLQERIATLEQQNAAIMNLLQTEYAQKISDYEMENNMLRGKIDEMNKKINHIESSMGKISESLQGGGMPSPRVQAVEVALPAMRAEPRVTYTVQAIIPGRAWLKSESGDTVTVAEGDILRGYGRVAKIDPYDGVVEIDTGTKVIALSYGMNAE